MSLKIEGECQGTLREYLGRIEIIESFNQEQIMALQEMVNDFLSQEKIAVVGVRTTMEDAANSIYKKLKDTGHNVVAINPKTDTYKGDPCYPSVKDIPGGAQAAVLVTRPELTEKVVRECKEAGITHVWMHRSIGDSTSQEAIAYCKENGINVIPGACPMMFVEPVDFGHKCIKFIGKFAGYVPK